VGVPPDLWFEAALRAPSATRLSLLAVPRSVALRVALVSSLEAIPASEKAEVVSALRALLFPPTHTAPDLQLQVVRTLGVLAEDAGTIDCLLAQLGASDLRLSDEAQRALWSVCRRANYALPSPATPGASSERRRRRSSAYDPR
jgi:hypothetical protein